VSYKIAKKNHYRSIQLIRKHLTGLLLSVYCNGLRLCYDGDDIATAFVSLQCKSTNFVPEVFWIFRQRLGILKKIFTCLSYFRTAKFYSVILKWITLCHIKPDRCNVRFWESLVKFDKILSSTVSHCRAVTICQQSIVAWKWIHFTVWTNASVWDGCVVSVIDTCCACLKPTRRIARYLLTSHRRYNCSRMLFWFVWCVASFLYL